MKRKSTMVELVQELEKIEPKSAQLLEVIAEAKAGEYHDYKNQKYDCGKIAVVGKLRALGLNELAQAVINGEYDEQADAEDIANMRSFAPREMWKLLGLE